MSTLRFRRHQSTHQPGGRVGFWRSRTAAFGFTCAAAALASFPLLADTPAPPWGRGSAAEPCVVCHSLEADGPFRVAPNLFNIVGAEKAREREWFGYSVALLTKGGTWTEEDLDLYLADANAFAPGTTKSIRITDPQQRKEIVDFLKTLRK
ncbi:MAG: hypothetical protein HC826_01960 [Rhodospirillales bacterium]|nr:hypothetical protein [Rhodospirillales bacterium]